jgi:8-oxo-dGTP diphosphatase
MIICKHCGLGHGIGPPQFNIDQFSYRCDAAWREIDRIAKERHMPECANCGCTCDPDGEGGVCVCDLACGFCTTNIVTAAVWIERAGLIAGVRSRKHHGRPEIPGGKARKGESPEDAARREVREEIGVEVRNLVVVRCSLVTIPNGEQHRCYVFSGTVDRNARLRGSAEGKAVWLKPRELKTHGTYRHEIPLVLAAVQSHRERAS